MTLQTCTPKPVISHEEEQKKGAMIQQKEV
jgi:hypothetical protein